jgi:LacI family transcriptional regulator
VAHPKRSRSDNPSRATIRDVAAAVGVSVATVSRVLNGRPDVSPATREAVLRHIREQGFSTSRTARGLAAGRTGLIGLAVPFMHPEYFAQIVDGAAEALYERDARLVVCPTQHQHDREVSLLQRVMHGTTDGALLILPSESPAELLHVRESGFPFVVVDPRFPLEDGFAIVAAANWAGARLACEHLIALGHERIGAITGPPGWCSSIERLSGYQSALLSAGLPVPDQLVVVGDFTIEGGYRAARQLLAESDPPTAIFAFSDNMAWGAIRAAKERGIRIPECLSLVGFDDGTVASSITPSLTTIRQPLQEMGRIAASLLCRMIDRHRIEATRLELSTRLIIRQSTAGLGRGSRRTIG